MNEYPCIKQFGNGGVIVLFVGIMKGYYISGSDIKYSLGKHSVSWNEPGFNLIPNTIDILTKAITIPELALDTTMWLAKQKDYLDILSKRK